MQLAGIADIFQIIVLIIVFIGPAIARMLGEAKKQTTSQTGDKANKSNKTVAELKNLLKSLSDPDSKFALFNPLDDNLEQQESSQNATVSKSLETAKTVDILQPNTQHTKIQPKLVKNSKKIVKKTDKDISFRKYLRGHSRKNTIILSEIMGKPHSLR